MLEQEWRKMVYLGSCLVVACYWNSNPIISKRHVLALSQRSCDRTPTIVTELRMRSQGLPARPDDAVVSCETLVLRPLSSQACELRFMSVQASCDSRTQLCGQSGTCSFPPIISRLILTVILWGIGSGSVCRYLPAVSCNALNVRVYSILEIVLRSDWQRGNTIFMPRTPQTRTRFR